MSCLTHLQLQKMTDSFHDKLAKVLSNSQKSKVEVAKNIGTSHSYIHLLISGKKTPTLGRLEELKKTLPMSETEYDDLLRAFIREDSDFSSILRTNERFHFTHFYAPFLTSLFGSDHQYRISLKKMGKSQFLGTELWLGYVNFEIRYRNYDKNLRFFIGKTTGGEIGLSWVPFDKLGPAAAVPEIPSSLQFTFKFSLGIPLIIDQLETAIIRTLRLPRVEQEFDLES